MTPYYSDAQTTLYHGDAIDILADRMTPTRPIAPAEAAQGMAHVSLFSGVGGFELAMQQAGIPTIAACEIDKAARGVLADHFPDTHIYHDVKGVTGDSLRSLGADPGRTVLTAGWPCQGNSVAGRRGGMADERSGLWAEVARILAEFRPAWFVGENVPGLLSVAGGWDYATVLGDMARLGYGFAWRVLDARRFGVPQRRRRIVLVGHLGDDGRAPAQVLLEPEGGGRNPAEGITPRPIFARRAGGSAHFRSVSPAVTAKWAKGAGGPAGDEDQNLVLSVTGTTTHAPTAERDVAATLSPADLTSEHRAVELVAFALRGRDDGALPEVHGDGQTVGSLRAASGGSSRDYIAGTTVRRLTPLEAERLQGLPDGWTLTSNGKPQADSARYKQLGNSIAVPVFVWVAKRLAAVASSCHGTGGRSVTRVLMQRSGRWSICCTVPNCDHYVYGITTEPEARRMASHHDAQHRRSQR